MHTVQIGDRAIAMNCGSGVTEASEGPKLALFGSGAMSDLSPQSDQKRHRAEIGS